MPTIHVPDATYEHLVAQAALRRVSVEHLAAELLDRSAREPPPAGPPATPTAEERQRALTAWQLLIDRRAGQYPPGFRVDDDRESIYKEREDAQR